MNEENNQIKPKSGLWEMVRYAIIALIVVIPFRIFIAQPYIVSGSSMDPTFENSDYLIVDQISKRFEEPVRQSVVIIRYPVEPSKFFIKRLIGFPGETIKIKDGQVTIYNSENLSGLVLEEPYVKYFKTAEDLTIELGEDQYFVLGDNRAGSSDSRSWGALPKKFIIGTPIIRLFPFDKIEIQPGQNN